MTTLFLRVSSSYAFSFEILYFLHRTGTRGYIKRGFPFRIFRLGICQSAFSDFSNDLSPHVAAGKTDTLCMPHGDGLVQVFHLFPRNNMIVACKIGTFKSFLAPPVPMIQKTSPYQGIKRGYHSYYFIYIIPISTTTKDANQASAHCHTTTPTAHLLPSSLRIAATAATQGV